MTACPSCRLTEVEQAHAEISRAGRWTYRIRIVDGIGVISPSGGWNVLGRQRAERRAAKLLAWYRRKPDEEIVTIVT